MRYQSIRGHLKPYSIVARRTTTIHHAFAAAIAPCDDYDDQTVRNAIVQLGQDPNGDLLCVYCGAKAETWDHVNATVRDKSFSGHGHRLGNLLPCCKLCNSKKGNKTWQTYLRSLPLSDAERREREARIANYTERHQRLDLLPNSSPEYVEMIEVKRQVLQLLARADSLADRLRGKS